MERQVTNRRCLTMIAAVTIWSALFAGTGAAAQTHAAGGWGTAQPVPGLAALNKGKNATTDSVSCASAGNCSAGGWYTTGPGQQGFVVGRS